MLLSDSSKKQGKLKKRNRKNSDTRRLSASGIGVLVFGVILLYIVFMVFYGAFRKRVATYEVTAGTLANDLTFTGIAVREETCVKPNDPDSVLLVSENEKIAAGTPLFVSRRAAEEAGYEPPSARQAVSGSAEKFLFSFSDQNFSTVYTFKQELLAGNSVSYAIENTEDLTKSGDVTAAPCDGVVSTVIDGYEGTTVSSIMSEGYSETANRSGEDDGSVKIVSSEDWTLMIPVTDKQVLELADMKKARVVFLSDRLSETASVKWLRTDSGDNYLSLEFSSGLIRYLKDRFIAVRIESAEDSGLKVPATAITTDTFFELPGSFRHLSGSDSGVHFMKMETKADGTAVVDSKGDAVVDLVSPTIYGRREEVTVNEETGKSETNIYYYVSASEFKEGDILLAESSEETYTVADPVELTGVFQVNNGYAIFRRVVIMEENEVWCLVQKGTYCGIVPHDYIIYDSSKARESMILTQ